jgi:hypothetical protein
MTRELSETARSLLHAAAQEVAPVSSRERARLRQQILDKVAAAPGAMHAPDPAIGGELGTKAFGLKVCAFLASGAGLGVVVAAGVSGFFGRDAEPTAVAKRAAALPAPIATQVLTPRAPVSDAPDALKRTPLASPSATMRPKNPARRVEGTEPAVADADAASELRAELDSMQQIQAALRDQRGAAALELIRAHDQRFPRGQLGSERLAAEVFAACQAGDLARAEAARARFLSRDTDSPLAQRVRATCDASKPGPAKVP